jgi:hypothetical protein
MEVNIGLAVIKVESHEQARYVGEFDATTDKCLFNGNGFQKLRVYYKEKWLKLKNKYLFPYTLKLNESAW